MLNVIVGKLGSDVEIKNINTSKGAMDVANNTVYVRTGENSKKDVPVQVTAWGDQSKELAKYSKGDTLMFVGRAKDVIYKPKGTDAEIVTMGYDIAKIDHDKTILKENDGILRSYINADKEKDPEKGTVDPKAKEKAPADEKSKSEEKKNDKATKQAPEKAAAQIAPKGPEM